MRRPQRMCCRDCSEPSRRLALLNNENLARMLLGASVVGLITLLQNHNVPATAFRVQKFPSASSLSIAFTSCFSLKLLEQGFLPLHLGESPGLLGQHAAVLLPPAVAIRMPHLDQGADVGVVFALGDQLLCRFQLADDLLGGVPGAFHGRVSGPVWTEEDSHLPQTDEESQVSNMNQLRKN